MRAQMPRIYRSVVVRRSIRSKGSAAIARRAADNQYDTHTGLLNRRTSAGHHDRARLERRPDAEVTRELIEVGLSVDQKPSQSVGKAALELAALGKKLGASGPTE